MQKEAYAGVDLAFAKTKRLPVVVCVSQDSRLEPLPLRRAASRPPIGGGNAQILDAGVIARFAENTVAYLRSLEREFGLPIRRIAVDAPSNPKSAGLPRRRCEQELDKWGIRCITTPSHAEFGTICAKAADHLASGGAESRMPGANQLWMLVGFEVFRRLREEWECIEVFPQAIVAVLRASQQHKSRASGLITQLTAVALRTGWPTVATRESLADIGFGSSHDRLDAYLSAWIASLDGAKRVPIGQPPDDVIWVPQP